MQKIILLFVGILCIACVYGQSPSLTLVASGGGNMHGENFSLDWSLGECMTETFAGTNFQLTQGFHQEKYVIVNNNPTLKANLDIGAASLNGFSNEMSDSEFNVSVYPNPVNDFIRIEFSEPMKSFKVKLTDMYGKTLLMKELNEAGKELDLTHLSNGIYLLRIINSDHRLVKSFKIIKNY